MLTGLERFVRLVVERESLVPRSTAPPSLNSSQDKSPKVNLNSKGGRVDSQSTVSTMFTPGLMRNFHNLVI